MENKIYSAICAVMRDINAIGKDHKNEQQKFQYRGIDDVMNELHGTLAKNGVFVVPEVLNEERTTGKSKNGGDLFYTRLKIRFAFYAEDGSHVDAVVIGEAMDSGDKASNKALSIGLKYAMLQVFCIPTEDETDPDGQSHEPQAGSMTPEKPAPKKPEPPKFDFTPKGGETTPVEKKELGALLATKNADGTPVFTKEEALAYSAQRRDKTARELINTIRSDLNARLGLMKASELPPEVEAVKEALQGEVVGETAYEIF